MPIKESFTSEAVKWIDVVSPSVPEMNELSQQYKLNQHSVRDCLQPEHLPKYEYDEEVNVHFIILRFYAHSSDSHIATIQDLTNKIAIFFNDEMIITIHRGETPFLEALPRRLNAVKRSLSATELISRIVWQALETYDDPASRLSEQLDFHENQILLKKAGSHVTEALYYIKRQASVAHRILMLMVEPINHIDVKAGDEAHLQDARDQHLKMQTLYALILEEVNNLLNVSMSFSAQRTNDVMRILTLFSVFFMPLTFIVGIYGMNFSFMPELEKKWGYPAVLLLMAIVASTIYFWFKRKKWL